MEGAKQPLRSGALCCSRFHSIQPSERKEGEEEGSEKWVTSDRVAVLTDGERGEVGQAVCKLCKLPQLNQCAQVDTVQLQ